MIGALCLVAPLAVIGGAAPAFAAVPGAPTIGIAIAGDGQATVTFTPPADDGGAAITGYTVTATDATTPGNGGQTATGSGSPLVVTGLTNGDSYTFTVTATNSDGTGPDSAASNAAVPAVPVVTADPLPTGLAATGVNLAVPLGLGGLLLACGAAILGVARLRRKSQEQLVG